MSNSDDATAMMIGFGKPREIATYITTIHIPNFTNVSTIIVQMGGMRAKFCYLEATPII